MPDNISHVKIPVNEWINLYSLTGIFLGKSISLENVGVCDIYVAVHATQPLPDHDAFSVLKRKDPIRLANTQGDSGAWVFCNSSGGLISVSVNNGFLPLIATHDNDLHSAPVNELFHGHTGVSTTIAANVEPDVYVITVVDGSSFSNGDHIQLENGIIETTFPTIVSGGGTNTFTLDRPLDNAFNIGDNVEVVITNMAVDGSVTPVSFKIIADHDQTWHIVRFLIGMIHSSAADDSKFGSLSALDRGCILRSFDASNNLYRTFTNWKSNFDLKMDMYDIAYTDKAGGGKFGTNARGSIKSGSGASPKINGENGDFLELLIQDDLTSLINFELKAQGHIVGL